MAGVDAKASLQRRLRRVVKLLVDGVDVAIFLAGPGVGFGIQLDAIGADLGGQPDLPRFRVHEQAGAYPQVFQFRDQRRHPLAVFFQVETVVGGELAVGVGYEGALRRPYLAHQCHEAGIVAHAIALALARSGEGVALDVEFHRQHVGQFKAVLRADVPLVRARVHGNTVRAGVDTHLRVLGHAGVGGVARVADQRDLVQVDAEGDHSRVLRLIDLMRMVSSGTSEKRPRSPVGAVAMKSTTSMPSMTSPNTV